MPYKLCKFGCDRSVIKDTIFRTKYLFGSISVPIGVIFLKLNTSFFPCIRYKERKFGTSLGKPRTFSPVSRLPLEEFPWNFIPALQKCKFCCNRSILRALCLAKKYFFACISASIGGIFLKLHTSHSPCIFHKWCKFGSDWSLINGTLLDV